MAYSLEARPDGSTVRAFAIPDLRPVIRAERQNMARLKALPSRLGRAPSRIAVTPATEGARTRHRDATQPWRAWYKTARWQRLRRRVLKRDGYVCQRTGVLLTGAHPAPNSPVVDHITPHRGDPFLFWDPENLQTVSKQFHDSVKQREERAHW